MALQRGLRPLNGALRPLLPQPPKLTYRAIHQIIFYPDKCLPGHLSDPDKYLPRQMAPAQRAPGQVSPGQMSPGHLLLHHYVMLKIMLGRVPTKKSQLKLENKSLNQGPRNPLSLHTNHQQKLLQLFEIWNK